MGVQATAELDDPAQNRHAHFSDPPDLVVKFQLVDIAYIISW
jgi:hypothetical protein